MPLVWIIVDWQSFDVGGALLSAGVAKAEAGGVGEEAAPMAIDLGSCQSLPDRRQEGPPWTQ
jgi:hypothetical protein